MLRWSAIILVLACGVIGTTLAAGQSERTLLTGKATDTTGAAVPNATVSLRTATFHADTRTAQDGTFTFREVPAKAGTISVRAPGFAPVEQPWAADRNTSVEIALVLSPGLVSESITVSATRTDLPANESAVPVVTLSADTLQSSGALTLDDKLRQLPGFTLFRRSGSRTTNPTAQGVSLRGLGASGASRALVISDGVPLNDPFGAWVYWDRIPTEEIAEVEVATGGASPLYGTNALGGVIDVIRKPVNETSMSLETSYGNENTPDASFFGSGRVGGWSGGLGLDAFHTRGYVPVDDADRGAVDTRAASEHLGGELTIERQFGSAGRVFARGESFGEDRLNGTPLQTNSTTVREIDVGGVWNSAPLGTVTGTLYAARQVYSQTFSAIALSRNSETLTRLQRVPAQRTGMDLQWTRSAGAAQVLVAGFQAYEVRGDSDETIFTAGRPSGLASGGGRQRDFGGFLEDLIHIGSRWVVTPTIRVDGWRNYDGFTFTQQPIKAPFVALQTLLPERTETFSSPRLGILYKLTSTVSLTAAGYRSYRAPTLNELYRSFRVGNVFTLNNSSLLAERLTGAEAGAIVRGWNQHLLVRGTFFWSEITRPIANVTVSSTPTLITRVRRNLGLTRAPGVELEATANLSSRVSLTGGYEYAHATVASFAADPTLVGKQIPQVPRHEFTIQARYSKPSTFTAAIQGRYVGTQFDDDQNLFPLHAFFTADAYLSHPVRQSIDVF
ncbi:MAG: TonB-dependent receptor, partial [Acidobacteriaceae bacterium]|nr:TonB-dependent receptor [Acidobacteriaceae bacterium]